MDSVTAAKNASLRQEREALEGQVAKLTARVEAKRAELYAAQDAARASRSAAEQQKVQLARARYEADSAADRERRGALERESAIRYQAELLRRMRDDVARRQRSVAAAAGVGDGPAESVAAVSSEGEELRRRVKNGHLDAVAVLRERVARDLLATGESRALDVVELSSDLPPRWESAVMELECVLDDSENVVRRVCDAHLGTAGELERVRSELDHAHKTVATVLAAATQLRGAAQEAATMCYRLQKENTALLRHVHRGGAPSPGAAADAPAGGGAVSAATPSAPDTLDGDAEAAAPLDAEQLSVGTDAEAATQKFLELAGQVVHKLAQIAVVGVEGVTQALAEPRPEPPPVEPVSMASARRLELSESGNGVGGGGGGTDLAATSATLHSGIYGDEGSFATSATPGSGGAGLGTSGRSDAASVQQLTDKVAHLISMIETNGGVPAGLSPTQTARSPPSPAYSPRSVQQSTLSPMSRDPGAYASYAGLGGSSVADDNALPSERIQQLIGGTHHALPASPIGIGPPGDHAFAAAHARAEARMRGRSLLSGTR